MSLDKALSDLNAAFDTAARKIEAQFPTLWQETKKRFGEDSECVTALATKNTPGWGDKSLIEVAAEYGEDAVIEHFAALDAGGYA